MTDALDTPVVMVAFTRPEHTAQVFRRVREQRPRQLFVLLDAPRAHVAADAERAAATRRVFDGVDWDCDLQIDVAPRNLGCSGRISSGLDRVFEQVERAIVLEDDVLPHPTFFRYCQDLLDRYADQPRVLAISGHKYPCEPRTAPYSYRFSRMFNCWGWATWRRGWRSVDQAFASYDEFRRGNWLGRYARSRLERLFYENGFAQAVAKTIEPWDWSVMYTGYVNHQLFVVPDRNLIANIGWGADATQQRNPNHILADLPTFPMRFPLQHPPFIEEDAESDLKIYDMIGPLTGPRFVRSIRKRVRRLKRNHYLRLQSAGDAPG